MSMAFVFPGQGSQAVGMGRALAESFATARDVFEEIDEALKQRLSRLMFEGPESELTLTENAQPALMAVGALSLSDAARLLKRRGKAMQEAVPVGKGAMAALLGADLEAATGIAEAAAKETGEVCSTANDNAPGQVVISGS